LASKQTLSPKEHGAVDFSFTLCPPKLQEIIDLACALFDGEVPERDTAVLLGSEHYHTGHIPVVPALWQEGADGGGLDLSELGGR